MKLLFALLAAVIGGYIGNYGQKNGKDIKWVLKRCLAAGIAVLILKWLTVGVG
jgi:hypothetical protein